MRYQNAELSTNYTPALNEIYVHEESISDVQDALVEFSTPSRDSSLSAPTIKEEIKHAIVATSVDTHELLEFLPIFCHITPSVSSFSDYLEFFCEIIQISVGPINIILLKVFNDVLLENLYILFLYS